MTMSKKMMMNKNKNTKIKQNPPQTRLKGNQQKITGIHGWVVESTGRWVDGSMSRWVDGSEVDPAPSV